MKMDYNYFVNEVKRTFLALSCWEAESQNNVDIDNWEKSGLVSSTQAASLRCINQNLFNFLEEV